MRNSRAKKYVMFARIFTRVTPKLPNTNTHAQSNPTKHTRLRCMHALRRLGQFPPIHHLPLLNEYSPSFHALWASGEGAVARGRTRSCGSQGRQTPPPATACFCGLLSASIFCASMLLRAYITPLLRGRPVRSGDLARVRVRVRGGLG